jgi:hypothetical protein
MRATLTFASAIVLVCLAAGAEPAHAACKRFGFTVNDYGKEGPIKDAKALLDKHIAKWAADQGISDYQTGKKDVSCELFLNFIVFDEHTCTASASVCWGGDQAKVGVLEEAEAPPPTPVRKDVAEDGTPKKADAAEHDTAMSGSEATPKPDTVEATADGPAGSTEKAAAETPPSAADTLADTMASGGTAGKSDEPAKAAEPAETAQKPAAETPPAAGVVVETGTLADNGASAPSGKPVPESPVKTLATYPDKDQAAAAAATAAAAAERAAAAAESAAAAAKEAAAAAVAASAASRGSIVPPLEPMPGADKAARAGAMGAH